MIAEGSEDELEISTQNIELDSIEEDDQKMVPPQTETEMAAIKTEIELSEYSNNNAFKMFEANERNMRITLKSAEELYARERLFKNDNPSEIARENYLYSTDKNNTNDQLNGFKVANDLAFMRAKEVVLAGGSLPAELEVRENGVFTKCLLPKGTKYGPFQGKWAGLPQHPRFAWEVSEFITVFAL